MPFGLSVGIFLLAAVQIYGLAVTDAGAVQEDHAVINEVHIDSVINTGGSEDDWVELYNPTPLPVALTGWSIQKTNATGGSFSKQALSGEIPARGYFLIVRNGSATDQVLKDAADLLVADAFSLSESNTIYLVNDNISIDDQNDPNIVDLLGFGIAAAYEGSAPAPEITETMSISRSPDGNDTQDNAADFVLSSVPSPTNSKPVNDINTAIGGTVMLTIAVDDEPVRNIGPNSAEIAFSLNASGRAKVNYGTDATYGLSTDMVDASEETAILIALSGLACGQTYHYSVFAENADGSETDETVDAEFMTLPCGITVDSLLMTKSAAKAKDNYAEGWEWLFKLTVWDMTDTMLTMKFDAWTMGETVIAAGGNMQFSLVGSDIWQDITENGVYSVEGAVISGDLSDDPGRQLDVLVRMKIPAHTKAGYFSSNYGIWTE